MVVRGARADLLPPFGHRVSVKRLPAIKSRRRIAVVLALPSISYDIRVHGFTDSLARSVMLGFQSRNR